MGGGSNEIQPTADQKAQQQINAKLWNYYVTEYKPLISSYSAEVTSPTIKEEEKGKVKGQINAEIMKSVPKLDKSGNPVKVARQLGQLGEVKTSAEMSGEAAVKGKEVTDTQNVINIGRGQATQASVGMGELASQTLSTEIKGKELSMEEAASLQNAVGSAVGMAASGAMYANKYPRTLSDPNAFDFSDVSMTKTGEVSQYA